MKPSGAVPGDAASTAAKPAKNSELHLRVNPSFSGLAKKIYGLEDPRYLAVLSLTTKVTAVEQLDPLNKMVELAVFDAEEKSKNNVFLAEFFSHCCWLTVSNSNAMNIIAKGLDSFPEHLEDLVIRILSTDLCGIMKAFKEKKTQYLVESADMFVRLDRFKLGRRVQLYRSGDIMSFLNHSLERYQHELITEQAPVAKEQVNGWVQRMAYSLHCVMKKYITMRDADAPLEKDMESALSSSMKMACYFLSCTEVSIDVGAHFGFIIVAVVFITRREKGVIELCTDLMDKWPGVNVTKAQFRLGIYSAVLRVLPPNGLREPGKSGTMAIARLLLELLKISKSSANDANVMLGIARALANLSSNLHPVLVLELEDGKGSSAVANCAHLCLTFVWPQLEHHSDPVRHTTRCILVNLTALAHTLGTEDSLVDQVFTMSPRNRTTFTSMPIIAASMGMKVIRERYPKVLDTLLIAIEDPAVSSLALQCLDMFLVTSWREMPDDLDRWAEDWMKPALRALGTAVHSRAGLESVVLRNGANLSPASLATIVDDKEQDLPFSIMIAMLQIKRNAMEAAQNVPTLVESEYPAEDRTTWRGLCTYVLVSRALNHQDAEVRLSMLSMVVKSRKTTAVYLPLELVLLRGAFTNNINLPTQAQRNHFLALAALALKRFADGQRVLKRDEAARKDYFSAAQIAVLKATQASYTLFIPWFLSWCMNDGLFPGANHVRRCTVLSVMLGAVATPGEMCNALLGSRDVGQKLLLVLQDEYESNKAMACQLLKGFTTQFLFESGAILEKYYTVACTLASSHRPPDVMTAAYIFKTITREASKPNTMTLRTRAVWMLLLQLRKQVLVAMCSLTAAAVKAPMHGCLLCIRMLVQDMDLSELFYAPEKLPLFSELLQTATEAIAVVSPVVNNASPEGHLPMDMVGVVQEALQKTTLKPPNIMGKFNASVQATSQDATSKTVQKGIKPAQKVIKELGQKGVEAKAGEGVKKTKDNKDKKATKKGVTNTEKEEVKATAEKEVMDTEKEGVKETAEKEVMNTEKEGVKAIAEKGDTKTKDKGVTKTEDERVTKTEEEGVIKTEEEGATKTEEEVVKATPKKEVMKTEEEGVKAPAEKGVTKTEEKVIKVTAEKGVTTTEEEVVKATPKKGVKKTEEEVVKATPEKGVTKIEEEGVKATLEKVVTKTEEEAVKATPKKGVMKTEEEGVKATPKKGVMKIEEEGVKATPEKGVTKKEEDGVKVTPKKGGSKLEKELVKATLKKGVTKTEEEGVKATAKGVVKSVEHGGLKTPGDGASSSQVEPTALDEMMAASEETTATAQMVLLCAWRTVKEASLLLGDLAERAPVRTRSTDLDKNKAAMEDMFTISEWLMALLSESKHRGAFEQAYIAFAKICAKLWQARDPRMHKRPATWVLYFLQTIAEGSEICSTRRSAGLPFIFQALFTTELTFGKSDKLTCLAMKRLLQMAHPEWGRGMKPDAHVKAMNVLRTLYRNTTLAAVVQEFVQDGIKVALGNFKSGNFAVRNASTLLFSALVTRIFGVQRKRHVLGSSDRLTGRVFFTRYPALMPVIVKELGKDGARFLALLLLSRLHPAPPSDGKNVMLSQLVPLVQQCAESPVIHVREKAASALVPLIPRDSHILMMANLFINARQSRKENHRHGCWLQILRMLEEMPETLKTNEYLQKCIPTWLINNCDLLRQQKYITMRVFVQVIDILVTSYFSADDMEAWILVERCLNMSLQCYIPYEKDDNMSWTFNYAVSCNTDKIPGQSAYETVATRVVLDLHLAMIEAPLTCALLPPQMSKRVYGTRALLRCLFLSPRLHVAAAATDFMREMYTKERGEIGNKVAGFVEAASFHKEIQELVLDTECPLREYRAALMRFVHAVPSMMCGVRDTPLHSLVCLMRLCRQECFTTAHALVDCISHLLQTSLVDIAKDPADILTAVWLDLADMLVVLCRPTALLASRTAVAQLLMQNPEMIKKNIARVPVLAVCKLWTAAILLQEDEDESVRGMIAQLATERHPPGIGSWYCPMSALIREFAVCYVGTIIAPICLLAWAWRGITLQDDEDNDKQTCLFESDEGSNSYAEALLLSKACCDQLPYALDRHMLMGPISTNVMQWLQEQIRGKPFVRATCLVEVIMAVCDLCTGMLVKHKEEGADRFLCHGLKTLSMNSIRVQAVSRIAMVKK